MDKYNDKTILGTLALLCILICISTSFLFLYSVKKQKDGKTFTLSSAPEISHENKEAEEFICVFVCGEVNKPGVYTLKKGSRVKDAVSMAGGLKKKADIIKMNLALKLKDEQYILIPGIGEIRDISPECKTGSQNSKNNSFLSKNSLKSSIETENIEEIELEKESDLISVNTATTDELVKLPGIGLKTAQKIINYREQSGIITDIEEIEKIPGIKKKSIEKCRKYLCID